MTQSLGRQPARLTSAGMAVKMNRKMRVGRRPKQRAYGLATAQFLLSHKLQTFVELPSSIPRESLSGTWPAGMLQQRRHSTIADR